MFCIQGGPAPMVPCEKLLPKMYSENRFFKPGIIHGDENTLVMVYLNDAKSGTKEDPDTWEVLLISKALVLENKGESEEGMFDALYSEGVSYGVPNGTADFAILTEEWGKAAPLTMDELIAWAER